MYTFKGWENNKINAFPSKRCISNEKTCYCYIFYNENHTNIPAHNLLIREFYLLKSILAYCGYSPTSPFFLLLSEHKHSDNATNLNSENARSRMVASLLGNIGIGTKKDESSTVCIWTAGFHHVMAHSRLVRVLKLMNHYFFNYFPNFFRLQQATDTGVHLHLLRGKGGWGIELRTLPP